MFGPLLEQHADASSSRSKSTQHGFARPVAFEISKNKSSEPTRSGSVRLARTSRLAKLRGAPRCARRRSPRRGRRDVSNASDVVGQPLWAFSAATKSQRPRPAPRRIAGRDADPSSAAHRAVDPVLDARQHVARPPAQPAGSRIRERDLDAARAAPSGATRTRSGSSSGISASGSNAFSKRGRSWRSFPVGLEPAE